MVFEGGRVGGYARGDEPRLRIVLAALDVFGAQGFEGTSTRIIAERAGVALPSLQYYFGGKQGLYHECARYIAAQISEVLDRAFARITTLTSDDAATSAEQDRKSTSLNSSH